MKIFVTFFVFAVGSLTSSAYEFLIDQEASFEPGGIRVVKKPSGGDDTEMIQSALCNCLLYTSDAADE